VATLSSELASSKRSEARLRADLAALQKDLAAQQCDLEAAR
jgi:hypothetical protein